MFSRPVSLRPARGAFLAIAAAALLLAACSSSGNSAPSAAAGSCTKADASGVVKLSAKNIAFDATCIEVPAGKAFTIEFTNSDTAPHDVAVYNDSGKSTEIFRGDPVDPGKSTTYNVPALDAGEHYFECTIHPNMNGKITAS